MSTIKLTVSENCGKTTFKDNDYYKYKILDSNGHYFYKLLHKNYKQGDTVEFALNSFKGKLSLKAIND